MLSASLLKGPLPGSSWVAADPVQHPDTGMLLSQLQSSYVLYTLHTDFQFIGRATDCRSDSARASIRPSVSRTEFGIPDRPS